MVRLSYLPKLPGVDVGFIDITYKVAMTRRDYCVLLRQSGDKTILKEISGVFRSGELAAIMGPSGSGKSSLMNILAGYRTSNVSGTLLDNGKERNKKLFRTMSCYIMQDDCLLPQLSVEEAMLVSATLKLDKRKSMLEKKLVVEDILQAIGLDDVMDTRTSDLSGGQRKRLSIALELVNNPPVMFCDEPTSGLDSSSCFQLVSLLESLAHGGRTIVCTIHQPSARLFEKFDNLYVLAEGQCIYQGHEDDLVPFLASFDFFCPSYHNPADYVLEVASGEYGEAVQLLSDGMKSLVEKPIQTVTTKDRRIFRWTPKAENIEIDPSIDEVSDTLPKVLTFQRGFIIQFWILLKRTFITSIRNKQLMHMRMASHIVTGSFIGMIYYDVGAIKEKWFDNFGCIFFTMLFIMFTGIMPTILTFPMEMSVFLREHLNYWYSLRAFYFAKTVADIPFQILFTGLYMIMMYFLTSQPTEADRVLKFAFICILTAMVAQSLGLLIGAGLSVEVGVFIGPVSNIPTILFSGFLVTFDTIPWYLKWLTYVSYLRYGFEGAVLAIYKGRSQEGCDHGTCFFSNSTDVLEQFSMASADYWVDAGALIAMVLGLRIIAYFVLKVKILSIR